MPKIRSFRAVVIASVAACAAVAFPAYALAAGPAFHDKIDETIPDVDICGFVGTLRVTGSQVITLTDTSIDITANASVNVKAPLVNVDAPMSKFSGVVKCETMIATSGVVSPAYTPGAGNVW